MSKVSLVPCGGCWLWDGATTYGYGRFRVDNRSALAHRHSYEMHVGPIPDGLVLDHLCRVKACVNPAHLEPVTQQANVRRGIKSQHPYCPQRHDPNWYIDNKGARHCRDCDRERTAARRAA